MKVRKFGTRRNRAILQFTLKWVAPDWWCTATIHSRGVLSLVTLVALVASHRITHPLTQLQGHKGGCLRLIFNWEPTLLDLRTPRAHAMVHFQQCSSTWVFVGLASLLVPQESVIFTGASIPVHPTSETGWRLSGKSCLFGVPFSLAQPHQQLWVWSQDVEKRRVRTTMVPGAPLSQACGRVACTGYLTNVIWMPVTNGLILIPR